MHPKKSAAGEESPKVTTSRRRKAAPRKRPVAKPPNVLTPVPSRSTPVQSRPTPPEPEAVDGLECRNCGCRHFYTIRTEPRPNFILRRKECRHCGRRVTTKERAIGDVA